MNSHKSRFIISLLLFSLLFGTSCHRNTSVTFSDSKSDKCDTDPDNSYHYILPLNSKAKLPLLVILDSGGDGAMAVEKTRPALTRIPCVVVGSDLVRNNYPDYDKAITLLISDAIKKFPVDPYKIFIAGFSGGARMAFEYAGRHKLKGVMMLGAGPDIKSIRELPCPVYMISGINDFNFAETYYNPLTFSGQGIFMSDYFRGRHEWPPAESMKDGYIFLMGLSTPNGKKLLKNESEILTESADSLINAGDVFFALKAVEKAINMDPENKHARELMEKIRTDKKLSYKIKKIESDLKEESRINQAYSKASMEMDSLWWNNELSQLADYISRTHGDQQDHYLRVKAFLGILFYSHLNSLLHAQPENKQIEHLLAAYKTAEPENPDVYYDYALYFYHRQNEKLSQENLQRALSLGFHDKVKMERDFGDEFLSKLEPE
ncbi:MAG: hypothetical protein H6540_09185 [Bacteroidales bacterium]|nr:hypothetical protein [Bacteroidales bacterium]MCB9014044.1 hypothetical protein [Bacteroidales bacterium]